MRQQLQQPPMSGATSRLPSQPPSVRGTPPLPNLQMSAAAQRLTAIQQQQQQQLVTDGEMTPNFAAAAAAPLPTTLPPSAAASGRNTPSAVGVAGAGAGDTTPHYANQQYTYQQSAQYQQHPEMLVSAAAAPLPLSVAASVTGGSMPPSGRATPMHPQHEQWASFHQQQAALETMRLQLQSMNLPSEQIEVLLTAAAAAPLPPTVPPSGVATPAVGGAGAVPSTPTGDKEGGGEEHSPNGSDGSGSKASTLELPSHANIQQEGGKSQMLDHLEHDPRQAKQAYPAGLGGGSSFASFFVASTPAQLEHMTHQQLAKRTMELESALSQQRVILAKEMARSEARHREEINSLIAAQQQATEAFRSESAAQIDRLQGVRMASERAASQRSQALEQEVEKRRASETRAFAADMARGELEDELRRLRSELHGAWGGWIGRWVGQVMGGSSVFRFISFRFICFSFASDAAAEPGKRGGAERASGRTGREHVAARG
jgi:hypothetical protein